MADQSKMNYDQLLAKIKAMKPGDKIKITLPKQLDEVGWIEYLRDLIINSGTDLDGQYVGNEAIIRKTP